MLAKNEGKRIGRVLLSIFFSLTLSLSLYLKKTCLYRQFIILQFLLTLLERTFLILENRLKKKMEGNRRN